MGGIRFLEVANDSIGEVFMSEKGVEMSSRTGKSGTGSPLPGTVALDTKRSLNKLDLIWGSLTTSLFSMRGGMEETF